MERIYNTLRENRKLRMTDEQLSDLGVDFYQFDIRTGSGYSFKEFHREGIPNGGWVVDRDTYSLLGGRREFLDFECTNTEKLEFPLDSLSCHEHKGHQRSIVGFCNQEKCGDKRPSSMEVFAIAALTHREMTRVDRKRSYKNGSDESRLNEYRSDECYFTSPHLVFLMDKFGGCRMFQSYFDGKLQVQFSELLDLGHMIAVPAYGEKYFDMVDRKDFLGKLNLLLKWAWHFPEGNTVANVPRICGN
ncbi:hypothetical protein N7519_000514 [Penicillium mononematosum]|uniref:uncharacterized protein n=1 Tax=Penicillium mononematosum TaxID=268346 RepID=UPI0025486941|nr:uncharacterized protein N7519_000514 [Penicillium mononematosum]KAJ6190493.1 hypothetical protein N7519_000514 [Penicillium mononematosum]